MDSTGNISEVDTHVRFLAWSIISCLLFFGIRGPKHEHYAPFSFNASKFDSASWQNPTSYGPTDNTFMLDDFLYQNRLVGMSRERIHQLLGAAAVNTSAVETFITDSGGCTMGSTYLEVQFELDSSKEPNLQKIARYRVVSEQLTLSQKLRASSSTDWFDR
ncbi:MAG: hypothetical protein JST89_16435 [Cyanobacteria bacterium SZAS-4]|nr:hypothetical protein [Cyanobacteria bacterium SZAS-4]